MEIIQNQAACFCEALRFSPHPSRADCSFKTTTTHKPTHPHGLTGLPSHKPFGCTANNCKTASQSCYIQVLAWARRRCHTKATPKGNWSSSMVNSSERGRGLYVEPLYMGFLYTGPLYIGALPIHRGSLYIYTHVYIYIYIYYRWLYTQRPI